MRAGSPIDFWKSDVAAKILLVEDHVTMRQAVRMVLEPEGFEVVEAADGKAALDRVGRDRPDIVLLDLNIPGLSGLSVLEALKKDPQTASVPVIVVSADDENARRRVMELGADGFFTKPFSPLALLETLERVRGGEDARGS
jgi:CheY-like chemotaxis protein